VVRMSGDGKDLVGAITVAAARGVIGFYDWEPNVLGDRGPDAPYAGGKALFRAVQVASRSKPEDEATDRRRTGTADRYYVFGSDGKPIGRQPRRTRPADPPAGARVLRVPAGIVVVEAERAPNQPATVRRYFVLEDDVELSNSDIENPEQDVDPRTNQPIVVLDFTESGRKAFTALTRRVAERGAQQSSPAGPAPAQGAQRFAIIVDDRVVSLVTIDPAANPEGIDARNGVQIQGLGSTTETRILARQLETGPLRAELIPIPVDN
jgi:hypothetical protein